MGSCGTGSILFFDLSTDYTGHFDLGKVLKCKIMIFAIFDMYITTVNFY